MSRSIALAGMMGVGKTTIGGVVAARLGRRLVDTDAELAAHVGTSITDLVAERGVAVLRRVERDVVREVAVHNDLVIALGGGAVLDDANVADLLLTGVVVHLDAPPAVLADRLDGPAVAARPLLGDDPVGSLAALHAQRDRRYREVADVTLDATGGVDVVAERVVQWVRGAGDVLTPSEYEVTM